MGLAEKTLESRGEAGRRRVLLPASEVLQDAVNFFFLTESLKERQQVQQLRVIHVVKPGLDWDLMMGKQSQMLFNSQ